jgi:hypothetical protein
MRSSFVNPDIPSLLCMVMVSPLRVVYLLALCSTIITRFTATTANSATHIPSLKSRALTLELLILPSIEE